MLLNIDLAYWPSLVDATLVILYNSGMPWAYERYDPNNPKEPRKPVKSPFDVSELGVLPVIYYMYLVSLCCIGQGVIDSFANPNINSEMKSAILAGAFF